MSKPPSFHEVRVSGLSPILLQSHTAEKAADKAMHTHAEGQVYLATQGLVVVETAEGRIIMPPGRLGWIPPMVPHGATIIGGLRGQAPGTIVGFSLYLLPALCAALPAEPVVLVQSDMTKLILQRMRSWPRRQALGEAERRLLDVFLGEIQAAPPEPLRLKMPRERRLAMLAAAIASDPADETSLDAWEGRIGMSRRTITRRFRDETGMSVVEWRQVARLQRGLELLGDGMPVTNVALTLGYDSVSSFIALFRRMLGTTPAKFAAQQMAAA
jgi:AraC-like DNA-binding protein